MSFRDDAEDTVLTSADHAGGGCCRLAREFGGLQGVKRAGMDDLIAVKGINHGLAERIYNHFHGGLN